jgi:hypothetical protein
VDQFVHKLVLAQVITVVPCKPDQIVSPIFLTTNHDGSLRLIFNMKKINKECITTTHFKLKTLQQILPLIPRGAWFTSWDLVQGFYNVLVHISQRRFFCFNWRGTCYQFRALPMGCSESPRIFSKVVRAVVYRARAMGINMFSYLDDTLTFDLSYSTAKAKSCELADLQELRLNRWDLDAEVTWPGSCRSDLEWWSSLVHPITASFESPKFSIHMTTDASLEGWAAVIGDSAFLGTWDELDGEDIALLELKAVLHGLQAFFVQPAPLTIHLSTDNMVTKAYVNHMGGSHLAL